MADLRSSIFTQRPEDAAYRAALAGQEARRQGFEQVCPSSFTGVETAAWDYGWKYSAAMFQAHRNA